VRRVFERLKSSGAIRLAGATLRNPEEFAACASSEWIDVITAPLAGGLIPDWPQRAAEAGKGVLVIEAMRCAGATRPVRSLADLWYLARKFRHRDKVAQPAIPPAEALKSALARSGVSAVLTTSVRLQHVRGNLAVAAAMKA
jgi:hypothetical protein